MPGACVEWNVLNDLSVAPDERVRRHALLENPAKEGMRIRIEIPGKELIDPRAAELPGRQADAVHNDEFRKGAFRARVEVWRQHLACSAEKTGGRMNVHARNSARIAVRKAGNSL